MKRVKYKALYIHAEKERRELFAQLRRSIRVLEILSPLGKPIIKRLLEAGRRNPKIDAHVVTRQEYELLKLYFSPSHVTRGHIALRVRNVPVVVMESALEKVSAP